MLNINVAHSKLYTHKNYILIIPSNDLISNNNLIIVIIKYISNNSFKRLETYNYGSTLSQNGSKRKVGYILVSIVQGLNKEGASDCAKTRPLEAKIPGPLAGGRR